MNNFNSTFSNRPARLFFDKYFPEINTDKTDSVCFKLCDIMDFIDLHYGQYLNKLFLNEWELIKLKEELAKFDEEHSDSLALIMENESQKILLKEFNNKLNVLFGMHAKDMKMAENVQRNLLFDSPPEVTDFDIAFHYRPCSSVSGDFYDFYVNKDINELKGVVLADVSGHGIASSLITILAKPIFFKEFNDKDDIPLNSVLDRINSRLIARMNASENYITAVLLRFKGNTVEYTNSAHPDIILRKASDNSVKRIVSENGSIQGSLLGIDAVAQPFSSLRFNMYSGDSLVLYTDCLIESHNTAGEEYGEEGIISVLSECEGLDASSILKNILKNFYNFTEEKYIKDDLSIIVLKKK